MEGSVPLANTCHLFIPFIDKIPSTEYKDNRHMKALLKLQISRLLAAADEAQDEVTCDLITQRLQKKSENTVKN